MRFWKLSPFLALGFLVLYQVHTFQAAPLSSIPESPEHHASLNKEEGDLLQAALIKNSMRRMAAEQEQETQPSITVQKRDCDLGTCVTNRLADTLHKFGGMLKEDFEPTDVGPESYGRRRRDLQS
ncbi:calcitonin gene-related peptide 2-like [Rhinolophus sinicus]|uniref:calcitonin gene-related peptide 2-like n=1 Tax=Rhinolophus sinicus TaxID=89399 RepID=UPI003D79F697